MRHRVVLWVYEGFELLDMAGPASAFKTADKYIADARYDVHVVSLQGGQVESDAGISVDTDAAERVPVGRTTTLLIVGGDAQAIGRATSSAELLKAFRTRASRAGRMGSVCSGAFLLAAAGLLEGRRAATHWAGTARLDAAFPGVTVDPDALYVEDGPVWTSAGVTAGIDMALAMIERDVGPHAMGVVAKRLVVYARRPGHQSQFSALLEAQSRQQRPLQDVLEWLDRHPGARATTRALARRAAMSERNFHRRFHEALGVTPAKYVETLRLDRAKAMLEAGESVKSTAAALGFRSEAGFRARFSRRFGVPPSFHRAVHRSATS